MKHNGDYDDDDDNNHNDDDHNHNDDDHNHNDDDHHQSSELSFFYRVWKEWEIVGNQFTSMLMTDGEPCIGPLSRAIKVSSESLSVLLQTLGAIHKGHLS